MEPRSFCKSSGVVSRLQSHTLSSSTTARRRSRPLIQAASYSSGPGLTPEGDALVASLRSVIDAALFGPRVVAGAALTLASSTSNETVRRLPRDFQEVTEAAIIYAEQGAQAEYDVFQSVSALVPSQIADAIPVQLRQLAPRPPKQPDVIDVEPYPVTQDTSVTLAVANSPETLVANQLAAEVAILKEAVVAVREAATALLERQDPAQDAMLRLNLQEARGNLARRLEQLSPQCSGGVGAEAVSEATMLLVELEGLL